MKNILSILLLVSIQSITAQTPPVLTTTSLANPDDNMQHAKNGNYAMDVNDDRQEYVGLWEYNQNGIVFQLKIEKQDAVLNKIEFNGIISNYNFTDQVILRYKLVKNNVVIFDNLNQSTDPITAYGIKEVGYDLYGRLLDQTRNVVGSYTISMVALSPPKINFNLILGNYTLQNPPSFYQDGQPLFSIPTGGIEMVKIN